ncbi:Proteasome subunit beta type-7 [Microtus ochrogaster]|uniref:Proteasome subunit beta type-7 n=1 Tax=Microtus ochrogaster TaxID=79684 RepID=A0A8J6KV92_MICOH|nr:Proteasome subunit beta type-7 [Microtus ochrogaster]
MHGGTSQRGDTQRAQRQKGRWEPRSHCESQAEGDEWTRAEIQVIRPKANNEEDCSITRNGERTKDKLFAELMELVSVKEELSEMTSGMLIEREKKKEHLERNAVLEADFAKKGLKLPKARKTGTTIAEVVYKDGIVLGADTRATEGMVVADKNCSKIHFISPNIYCCGAGTAADTDMTTQLISSNLELHSLTTSRLPRVVTANRMLKQMLYRYQGYIGAALVLGGVDVTGPHLYSIYPHGSTDKLPYVTMGFLLLGSNGCV